ncbi:trypsin-like peptidase domain-containing protein [Streptomyces sp. ACT015]|uniref:trypsin-like peptidase domain-containing protein n=1 Tax=Streptomyces sp. ACT015 TaxID=3134807 RepID=UPI003D166C65
MTAAPEPSPEPLGFDPRRAVQVLVETDGGPGERRRGSGYRVTADTVLTAAHVVRDASSVRLRFADGALGTTEVPGTRVWSDTAADIAVLRIEPGPDRDRLPPRVTPVRFARVTGVVECEALGFPRFKLHRGPAPGHDRPSVPYRDSHHARGTTSPFSNLRRGTLELALRAPEYDTDGRRSPWEGMSGAAVWSAGRLIGVVSEHHRSDGLGTLTAGRVDRWYTLLAPERIGELGELIGLPPDAERLTRLPPPPGGSWLDAAARDLASWVERQWSEEERRRSVHDPFPMRVCFRNATGRFDNWSNVRRTPPSSGTPSPPLPLAGPLERIVEVYRSVPSRRLVVLGEAGAGKTILALRLVLDRLRAPVPGDPVPVIFSLGSWDPAESLHDWMRGQLVRDYPDLNVPSPEGGSLADALLRSHRVLPVLDGFDEMAEDLRSTALRAVNATVTDLVLTSRPEEYDRAVRAAGVVLRGAPGIVLDPLDPRDLATYLRRASPPAPGGDESSTAWEPVLRELARRPRGEGAENVARVLGTPLMVALARTVYQSANGRSPEDRSVPEDLLDVRRFPTARAVEDHLLAAFLPAAYDAPPAGAHAVQPRRRGWDAEQAAPWLGYLARHLDRLGQGGQVVRDLAWWELGTTLRRSTRTFAVGALAAVAFGVTTAVGNIPVDLVATAFPLGFALRRGAVVGVLHGLAAGSVFGFIYWWMSGRGRIKPLQVRARISRGAWKRRDEALHSALAGLVVGAVASTTLILLDRVVVSGLGLDDGQGGSRTAALVFVAELTAGGALVFGLTALLEAPLQSGSATRPTDLLNANRRRVAHRLVLWALVIGPLVGVVEGLWHGPLRGLQVGTVFGLEAAFGAGLAYGCGLTAWGQWVALARIWLPLTGRLPWRLMAFLDDAHQREVLRQAGAVYQFRHASVQEHLTGGLRDRTTAGSGGTSGNRAEPHPRHPSQDKDTGTGVS